MIDLYVFITVVTLILYGLNWRFYKRTNSEFFIFMNYAIAVIILLYTIFVVTLSYDLKNLKFMKIGDNINLEVPFQVIDIDVEGHPILQIRYDKLKGNLTTLDYGRSFKLLNPQATDRMMCNTDVDTDSRFVRSGTFSSR